MAVITIDSVTAIENRPCPVRPTGDAPPAAAVVSLDATVTTRCRRRVHLDHDPEAVGFPRALPDPSLEQRRDDAAAHRARIGERLAAAAGPGWCVVPASGSTRERIAATAAAVDADAPLIWGAVLPDVGPAGRRGGAELLVRVAGGGYLPVIVVRHRITDPGSGALTSPLVEPSPRRALPDPERKVRSQPRDLLRLAHLNRMLHAAGWAPVAASPPHT